MAETVAPTPVEKAIYRQIRDYLIAHPDAHDDLNLHAMQERNRAGFPVEGDGPAQTVTLEPRAFSRAYWAAYRAACRHEMNRFASRVLGA